MASSMKIAILGGRGFPSTYGGYETLVRYLARDWVRKGHEVTVYSRERSHGRSIWDSDGVRCIWTPGLDSKSASTLTFGASSHLDAAARNYDAVLVLNIANGFYLPLLRARGIPTVLNTDGLEWERGKWGQAARRVFYTGAQLSARYADVLICDSEAIGEVWKREFGVVPSFIPYGGEVPAGVGAERVAELGLIPRSYALSVARLAPENNVELTLDAWAAMDTACEMVVVGSANYPSPLEARLKDLGRDTPLRWLGHVADQDLLAELWANAGVYIHGHSVGGTNPALVQALGYGAPTLALDTPFNREVIKRDDQLFARDPVALARRMQRVMSNETIKLAWSEHGREVVSTRYRWQDVCDAYEDALRQAQSRRVGRGRSRRVGRQAI